MTRKTTKDKEKEISSLKDGFSDLKNNLDTLSANYEALETNHNQCMSKSKSIFKCKLCEQRFDKQGDLKEHKRNHHVSDGNFVCEQCDKSFAEEWKLTAHIKTHKSYPCNQCDKIFIHKETELKHIRAAHEHLYCSYFNNRKECPYNNQCVYRIRQRGCSLTHRNALRLLSVQE